jgi:tRNA(Ile)-lysidine synthetase-like protein
MDVLERVRNAIEHERLLTHGDGVVVGVSGGPDSLCLLHVLGRLSGEYALNVHVAHLNHQLRGAEAESDAQFVAELSQAWGLPATVESVDVTAMARERKLAIEEAARQARYAFLARVAQSVGAPKIAVAHNADDQVETILMHALRGSGLAGLRGMQPMSRLDELRIEGAEPLLPADATGLLLIRPLLAVPRREIEAYCQMQGLQPRFDRSNLDTTYYRNRLRHDLLPFLETFNPGVRQVILRSASILSADYDCLREQAARAWTQVVRTESPLAIRFDLRAWRALPLALQRSTVREAIHHLRHSLRNINWVHVEDAVRVLRSGSTGARATLPRGLEAWLSYDEFVLADAGYQPPLPDQPTLGSEELPLRIPGTTPLPGSAWRLRARVIPLCDVQDETLRPASPWQAYLDYAATGKHLSLRTRRPSDHFWPQGLGAQPTTLNGFLTNAKLPRAWRDHMPLLVSPSQVCWVAGLRIDERVKVTHETSRVLELTFEKRANTSCPQLEVDHVHLSGFRVSRGSWPGL